MFIIRKRKYNEASYCGSNNINETYRYENVQKVLQCWQLRNKLLDDFTEGLEYGVVVDAGQVEAEDTK